MSHRRSSTISELRKAWNNERDANLFAPNRTNKSRALDRVEAMGGLVRDRKRITARLWRKIVDKFKKKKEEKSEFKPDSGVSTNAMRWSEGPNGVKIDRISVASLYSDIDESEEDEEEEESDNEPLDEWETKLPPQPPWKAPDVKPSNSPASSSSAKPATPQAKVEPASLAAVEAEGGHTQRLVAKKGRAMHHDDRLARKEEPKGHTAIDPWAEDEEDRAHAPKANADPWASSGDENVREQFAPPPRRIGKAKARSDRVPATRTLKPAVPQPVSKSEALERIGRSPSPSSRRTDDDGTPHREERRRKGPPKARNNGQGAAAGAARKEAPSSGNAAQPLRSSKGEQVMF